MNLDSNSCWFSQENVVSMKMLCYPRLRQKIEAVTSVSSKFVF